jgi:hypothetical protein
MCTKRTIEHCRYGRRQLEFVAIKRKDTGDWAIPGGMVDPGESVSLTLKREFGEETMNALELPPEANRKLMSELTTAFETGLAVYSGYVRFCLQSFLVSHQFRTAGCLGRSLFGGVLSSMPTVYIWHN